MTAERVRPGQYMAGDARGNHLDEPRRAGTHWKADGRPKISYPSRHVAESCARRILGHGGPQLFAYPCQGIDCTAWHLSSSRRRAEA